MEKDRGDQPEEGLPRLTRAEDAELRQLTWFSKLGNLSEKSQGRLLELRARDRRSAVRDARPDPTSKVDRPAAARFERGRLEPTTCSNCGFALPSQARPCSNCGFVAPTAGGRPAAVKASPAPRSPGGETPGSFANLDLPTYRTLLERAALGVSPPPPSTPTTISFTPQPLHEPFGEPCK